MLKYMLVQTNAYRKLKNRPGDIASVIQRGTEHNIGYLA